MCADLVNLRQFKKRKARLDKEKTAEENRVAFGRTKSEKAHTARINELDERKLDQKRLSSMDQSEKDTPDGNTSQ